MRPTCAGFVVVSGLVACGGPTTRVREVAVTPAPNGAPAALATQPCLPVQRLGDPPVLVIGGQRDRQMDASQIVTLGNGDGFLLGGSTDLGAEVSWWSHGECKWRAPIDELGMSPAYAGYDTVWARSLLRPNYFMVEVWKEIDASGRIVREVHAEPYVRAVVVEGDHRVLMLSGLLGEHAWWQIGAARPIARVPLHDSVWSIAAAATPGSNEVPAVLATTITTGMPDGARDPQIVLPDGTVIRIGEGPTAQGGAIAAVPSGGWVAAYGTSTTSGKPPTIAVVRVDRDGHLRWTTAIDGEPGALISIDPTGLTVFELLPSGARQPRRLAIDLEHGTLTKLDSARGPAWVAGGLHDASNTFENVSVELETWHVEATSRCDVECDDVPAHEGVARATFLLPPLSP